MFDDDTLMVQAARDGAGIVYVYEAMVREDLAVGTVGDRAECQGSTCKPTLSLLPQLAIFAYSAASVRGFHSPRLMGLRMHAPRGKAACQESHRHWPTALGRLVWKLSYSPRATPNMRRTSTPPACSPARC